MDCCEDPEAQHGKPLAHRSLLLSVTVDEKVPEQVQGGIGQGRVGTPSPPRLELGILRTEPKHMGVRAASLYWSSLAWLLRLGVGLSRGPWVEGKEENQLRGNYAAVGSGAHDAVFIEQFLIPRSQVNPFQASNQPGVGQRDLRSRSAASRWAAVERGFSD